MSFLSLVKDISYKDQEAGKLICIPKLINSKLNFKIRNILLISYVRLESQDCQNFFCWINLYFGFFIIKDIENIPFIAFITQKSE